MGKSQKRLPNTHEGGYLAIGDKVPRYGVVLARGLHSGQKVVGGGGGSERPIQRAPARAAAGHDVGAKVPERLLGRVTRVRGQDAFVEPRPGRPRRSREIQVPVLTERAAAVAGRVHVLEEAKNVLAQLEPGAARRPGSAAGDPPLAGPPVRLDGVGSAPRLAAVEALGGVAPTLERAGRVGAVEARLATGPEAR